MVVSNPFTQLLSGGAFPWLSLQQTNEIKEKSKLMSTNPYDQTLIQNDLYKQELSKKTHEDYMKNRQVWGMQLEQKKQTAKDPVTKNSTDSIKKMWALADMYRQYWYEHGKNRDDMWDEELVSRFNTKNPQAKKYADAFLTGWEDSEYRLSQQLGLSEDSYKKWKSGIAKEKLSDNFWSNVWSKMKVWYNQSLDQYEKSFYRIGKNIENIPNTMAKFVANNVNIKGLLEKKIGREITDEQYEKVIDWAVNEYDKKTERNQQSVLDYIDIVNYAANKYAEENKIDEDIEQYYNNKSMTKSLLEWDIKGFVYKSAWDMAQNREMLPIIWVTALNPTVWTALMATDSYVRESEDAFETMLNNGATYEQAEKGAVAVWIINAAIEVWLEKLIWWVETAASDSIRKAFTKNVQEEAVKKWLGRVLLDAGKTQVRASTEEGLEEIFQQIVQNAFVKTVNENQDLFEWAGLAFEWGFYNPLNLMAWGWNITQNLGNIDYSRSTNTDTNENTSNTSEGNLLDRVTDWGAQKITGTVSAQDKLYKAQEPRMNTLTSKKDLSKRRANSDRANQLIVENGYVPTNTTERVEAHQATLNKLWNQVKEQVNQGEWITVDQTPIIEALRNYIEEKKSLNIAAIDSDITALEKELASLERGQQEGTDLPTLENKKQVYNDLINWKGQEASEVYKAWLKLLTAEIWKIEDSMLTEIPWEFSNLKRDVWALIDAYDDVFKADMKNQRNKGMWLTEAYSRIEWVGDIIEGALGVFKWEWGKVLKWLWKVALGKSLAKARDVDFLVQQGFKELAEQMKKNQTNNNETYKNQIEEWAQPVAEMTEDEKYQEMVNRIMTPEEAMEIVELAWRANNLKEFYEGKYNNWEEWLRGEWPDTVEMYVENTFTTQRMIESHPELLDRGTMFSEVLDAYLNGTLVGTEKAAAGDIDLSQPVEYTPTKFYEPQQIKDGKALREKANQRVTKSNRNEVYKARGEFITQAHDQNFITELWLTDAEVNKKLKERSNYTVRSKELSNRINRGVAPQYRRAWLENSSIVNEFAVTDEDLENMVKKVEWKSEEYERKYISNAMLALNTHIDWSNLTFQFVPKWSLMSSIDGRSTKIAWDYNPHEDIIRIANSWQNTVAHEMWHFLDWLWGRQLYGYNVTLSEWGNRETIKQNLTEDQKNFVAHFDNFISSLRKKSDTSSDYLMTPTEMFARFVARFTEWTRKTATNNRWDYESRYYNDRYLESDYIEFTKLLQEKSKLDLENNYANYEEYKNRFKKWSDSDTKIVEKRLDNDGKNNYNSREGLAEEIVDNWGITLEMADNNNVGGKPYVAVSPYPNRSEIIKVEDFNDAQVRNYVEKNADKLLQKGYALGWRVNEWNVYLDVSIVLPKSMQKEALEIANKYNQKAIFDLETFEDIPAEWNWEYMDVDEEEVSDYIRSLFNK